MQIFVKDLEGQCIAFDVHADDDVTELLSDIQERLGVHRNEVRLIFGRQLEAGSSLNGCGIREGSTVAMARRLRGGAINLSTDWKAILEEALWTIQGRTDFIKLTHKVVYEKFCSRSYLDSMGFADREEGDLGPIHGWQWRHWGAQYKDSRTDYSGQGIDQLSQLIHNIKSKPNDRRLILCSWNVSDLHKMALKPCQCLMQFYVCNGKLSCLLYQRSRDIGLGIPFNVATYALIVQMIAHVTDLRPGDFSHIIAESLVGSHHKQPHLELGPFPRLLIKRKVESIDDFKIEDFEFVNNISSESNDVWKPPKVLNFLNSEMRDEESYLKMVKFVLDNGTRKDDRTGVGTISCFGTLNRYSLINATLPLLTTKRVFWRGILEELLWFIRGNTDSCLLADKNVHIWDANGSRSFLDSLGFSDRDEGDLGPVYGHQWRHWGANYKDKKTDYSGQGIDQLSMVIEKIKSNSHESLIVCSWNICDIPLMALPPCHCLFQFLVTDGKLSCILYQRSGDIGLGVPFNIASYALLTHMVAHVTNLEPGEFFHCIGDAHIYLNHVDPLKMQLTRDPRPFPKLEIKRKVQSIYDFKTEDFEVIGYKPHPKIEMEMAV